MFTHSGISFTPSAGSAGRGSGSFSPQLPLSRWATLECYLRQAWEGEVEAGSREIEADDASTYHAWLVTEGGLEWEMARGRFRAGPGAWLVAPQAPFRRWVAPATRALSIIVCCRWPSGRHLFSQDAAAVFPASRHPVLERRARLLTRLVERDLPEWGPGSDLPAVPPQVFLCLQRRLLAWMDVFLTAMQEQGWSYEGTTDARVSALLAILERGPLDANSLWGEVQKGTGLDKAGAQRLFETVVGTSLATFWARCRLRHVQTLLACEDLSIKELSYRMGFSHQGHFTRWFKKRTGASPQAYRARAGGADRGRELSTAVP